MRRRSSRSDPCRACRLRYRSLVAGWDESTAGVLRLPSGRLIRGRALRQTPPEGEPPDFALVLTGREPIHPSYAFRWVRWADFGLPADPADARDALREAWVRAAEERVEVGCPGGRGRTGTALACLAVLDGVAASKAVDYVRRGYHRRAVETPGQQRFVRSF